jgi:hypothetical protein
MSTMKWLIIVCIVLASSVLADQAKSAGGKDGETNNATETASQTGGKTKPPQVSAVRAPPDKSAPEQNGQSQTNGATKDSPEWENFLNAIATAVIALFTIALFVGVVVQIRTSRNIERAWVVVDIKHEGRELTNTTIIGDILGESTSIPLRCISLNGGRSPAWVIEKRIAFEIFENADAVPRTSPIKRTRVFDDIPHAVYTQEHSVRANMPIAQGRLTETNIGVIYGVVRYRDIFNKIRGTTFGYKVLPAIDTLSLRLEPLKNRPKYNKNT